jgi:predicted aldo/keto reductase-like oxidoreductase
MKVLAAGKVTTHVEESLRYSLSLPVSAAVVGMGTVEEVAANARFAKRFRPMTTQEADALIEKTMPAATADVMWWKRT